MLVILFSPVFPSVEKHLWCVPSQLEVLRLLDNQEIMQELLVRNIPITQQSQFHKQMDWLLIDACLPAYHACMMYQF